MAGDRKAISTMTTPTEIRRLNAIDAAAYRKIRLEALQSRPDAFGSAYESECDLPRDAFVEKLARDAVFGAFAADALLGIAGFHRLDGARENHKGLLWSMYVRETARGGDVADALVKAVVDHASGEVEALLLAVGVHNEAARRLYRRHSFVEYGREPRALKVGDVYYDEIMMRLDLRA